MMIFFLELFHMLLSLMPNPFHPKSISFGLSLPHSAPSDSLDLVFFDVVDAFLPDGS